MRNNEKRFYEGYQPSKLPKDSPPQSPQHQAQPELNQIQTQLLEQQTPFTAQFLSQSFAQLSSAIESNTIQRLKHSQSPQHFFESEALLHSTISKLTAISAYPDLIPDFISTNLLKLLTQVLSHPNQQIIKQTVEVIYEFLMIEIEQEAIAERHIRYWKKAGEEYFLEKLLGVLERLNEDNPEEYETVYRVLRIVEQLLTINPGLADVVVDCSKIMKYLADRILPNFIVEYRKIDDNKFISSEILLELVQFSKENRFTFNSFNGMEILLECIKPYQDQPLPKDMELQFLINIFNIICILNIEPSIKQTFSSLQGIELMLHFLKLKNQLSKPALKCLASGLYQHSVPIFINNNGIKYIFPILLHHGIKQKQRQEQMVIDENTCIIILELLKWAKGKDEERVVQKFKEKNFEKLLRLVEMRVEYSDMIGEGMEILEQEEYLKKLGEGLRVIEIIDLVMLGLVGKSEQMRENAKEMMKYFGFDAAKVENGLRQQMGNLDKQGEEWRWIDERIGKMFPFMYEGNEEVEGNNEAKGVMIEEDRKE